MAYSGTPLDCTQEKEAAVKAEQCQVKTLNNGNNQCHSNFIKNTVLV